MSACRSAAASTVNRLVAAVRAFFEYLMMPATLTGNPVPSPRWGQDYGRRTRTAWSAGPGSFPWRRSAGAPATSAAAVPPRRRGGCVRVVAAHAPGVLSSTTTPGQHLSAKRKSSVDGSSWNSRCAQIAVRRCRGLEVSVLRAARESVRRLGVQSLSSPSNPMSQWRP